DRMSVVSVASWLSVTLVFSSRRRHTISKRDWSSDVCSSDLVARGGTGRNARADAGDDRTEVGQHGDDDRDDVDEARPLDGDEIVEAEVEQRFEEALLAGLGMTVSGVSIALWIDVAGLMIGAGLR